MASTSKKSAMEIEERNGAGRLRNRWVHEPDGRIVEAPTTTTAATTRFWEMNVRQVLYDAFLPIGYPDSVTPDYLGYQTYDSLQAFFSTITSLLANRAVLQGLGVGDANSSATYALLMTILKDGISRVATITFAYRFGLVIEPECKKYRFLADIFNDSAFFLDLFSPLFGAWPKVVALVFAEALRAMCGVAAGASKAALSKHFARRNNLSELNAKESSQETAVGLFGLLIGSVVVRYVESREAVFTLMVILIFVHLGMNYLGVRCVQLDVLNQQRATILFQHFLNTGKILSPAEVAKRESIIFWKPIYRPRGEAVATVVFATSYADAMTRGIVVRPFESNQPGSSPEQLSYQLCLCRSKTDLPIIKILLIGDPLRLPAGNVTTLEAWFSALCLVHSPEFQNASATEGKNFNDNDEKKDCRHVFEQLESAGWNLSETNLDTSAPWMTIKMGNGEGKKEL
ncbi:DUF647 domain-containing protein [Colletotrichum truncatum]|uniref:DUF647 domain-containing protein n=1 Tax=Colletotrichum truncatum TaxID=5467 RepID=A0ACC3YRE2_COLTU|nr:duf647 domain-containing protein [Colletotrichum truncatum]KAF6799206.1 duf647 domain-containing protein [Colletotrichum truncatum]